jgi:hypothetical protein
MGARPARFGYSSENTTESDPNRRIYPGHAHGRSTNDTATLAEIAPARGESDAEGTLATLDLRNALARCLPSDHDGRSLARAFARTAVEPVAPQHGSTRRRGQLGCFGARAQSQSRTATDSILTRIALIRTDGMTPVARPRVRKDRGRATGTGEGAACRVVADAVFAAAWEGAEEKHPRSCALDLGGVGRIQTCGPGADGRRSCLS